MTEHNDSLRSDYVVPESIADRPFYERLDWLLEDMKSDDLMHGVPRYQPRYTAREHELASYLASLDRNPRSGHIVHQDVLNRGWCDICGAPNNDHREGER